MQCVYHLQAKSVTAKKGFEYNMDFCEDIDECSRSHDCSQSATCANSEGSYTCACKSGYFGDGKICQEGSCTEKMCPVNEECVSLTSLDCRCKDGFERNESGLCVDTDECSEADVCYQNANCTNEIGSFNCSCNNCYWILGRRVFLFRRARV